MTDWKKFKYRNLWQTSLWGDFQKSIGRKVHTFEVDGASAIVISHPLPFGLCWIELPRGPLFSDEKSMQAIFDKVIKWAKSQKAVFVRTSSYEKVQVDGFKSRISQHDHHPETSLVIDLSQSEEEILAQMKPKGRYNIKVAERHDIAVAPGDNIDAFYALLSKTANRDGFAVHPKSYYEKMMRTFHEDAELLLATYEERVVAGGIFIYLDEWGIYYYGASDHNYRNLMAPYLIQWAAIREAKKRGCKFYDFLGISPEGAHNHAWAGVTSFKKKFGGIVKNYPLAQDIPLRPIWYFLYRFRKSFGG